jgi:hypothetical protein
VGPRDAREISDANYTDVRCAVEFSGALARRHALEKSQLQKHGIFDVGGTIFLPGSRGFWYSRHAANSIVFIQP